MSADQNLAGAPRGSLRDDGPKGCFGQPK